MITVVAALIEKEGKYLIARRSTGSEDVMGKWEFPGGKVEKDESEEHAIEREIKEECGIHVKREQISIINPLLFSTPGMSDESNALVCVKVDSIQNLNADGCEGSELFDGYSLLTIEDALRILKNGKDDNHIFYSVYTWAALMVFVSKMWLWKKI